MLSYNGGMKTEVEIEVKKIRKKLRVYGIPEDERARLREALDHLKSLLKAEKRTLESH